MAIPIYDTFAANINNPNAATMYDTLAMGGSVDLPAPRLPLIRNHLPGLTADFEYLLLWIGAVLIILSIIGGSLP